MELQSGTKRRATPELAWLVEKTLKENRRYLRVLHALDFNTDVLSHLLEFLHAFADTRASGFVVLAVELGEIVFHVGNEATELFEAISH